ncbi:hypothetical protein TDB9533_02580 [Thalassocella blandensis]|nr:hypothetical protein TDB9533_02580 [Thalassocella blandensis]
MKTLFGYVIAAYLAATLALSYYLSTYDNIPDVYLPPPAAYEFPKPPNFAAIDNAKKKKQAFFNYFTPIIQQVNSNITVERDTLLTIEDKYYAEGTLSEHALTIIDDLSGKYGIEAQEDKIDQVNALLKRVNIVPTSLALAQAANESGWGTSRFAKKGNNYFGMWCYSEGCGYVPNSRIEGAQHEVRKFASPAQSVEAYIHNINTHLAYRSLRNIRQQAVNNGNAISGALLADGLLNYSERREAYVAEIKSMIRRNKLDTERLILTTD